MKRFFSFETVSGLFVALVVLSALTGFAGNALKAVGIDGEALGAADALTGLATLVVAVLGWFAARKAAAEAEAAAARARRRVLVFLAKDGEKKELPLHLRAVEVTRAEMLGRMGMMPMKDPGKRFTFAFFGQQEFLSALNAIADGESDELAIPVTEAEMDQFDWCKIAS